MHRFQPSNSFCNSLAWTIALLLIGHSGCSERNSKMASVEGVVRVNGKPLSSGRVVFQAKLSGVNAQAEIGPDGTFTLATRGVDGAMIGEHQVAIIAAEKGVGGRPDPKAGRQTLKWLVPEKYLATGTSGLTYEVKAGENHPEFDIDMP